MTTSLVMVLALLGHDPTDTTVRLPRGGSVEIDVQNNNVTVHTGTSDLVTIRGTSASLDGRTLSVGDEDHRHPAAGLVDVTLPAWARVSVSAVNGNLVFDGAPADLEAETVSGNIKLTGGTGSVQLTTVAGSVTVNDFKGTRLSVEANAKDVNITNATGRIEVDCVGGSIHLRGIRSNNVAASTISGSLDFEGPLAPTGTYEFESHNNGVTLYLPIDVSARMRISTFNGEFINAEIPATTGGKDKSVTPPPGGRSKPKNKMTDPEQEILVVYGKGEARVTVDSFNGNVVVKKKP